jgi:hypothetical protein
LSSEDRGGALPEFPFAERNKGGVLREFEFLDLLDKVLPRLLDVRRVVREPVFRNARPDFIVRFENGDVGIVEAKSVSPNTRPRLLEIAEQLDRYVQAYLADSPGRRPPKTVLAVSGALSSEHRGFLHTQGVDLVLDGPQIRAALENEDSGERPSGTSRESASGFRSAARGLVERLEAVAPGRKQWSVYQTICGNILSFVLCPPLARPISERLNRSGVNRRDFIFPNYAAVGFWEYMRTNYQAHYVVVDAKNYVGRVKKTDVLQLANYLTAHGTGLFGLIVTRGGGDRGAEVTRREQWVIHGKLIVVLNDDDLKQMLTVHASGQDAADVVRQKIEDFRLGF